MPKGDDGGLRWSVSVPIGARASTRYRTKLYRRSAFLTANRPEKSRNVGHLARHAKHMSKDGNKLSTDTNAFLKKVGDSKSFRHGRGDNDEKPSLRHGFSPQYLPADNIAFN